MGAFDDYYFWVAIKMQQWITKHTYFAENMAFSNNTTKTNVAKNDNSADTIEVS